MKNDLQKLAIPATLFYESHKQIDRAVQLEGDLKIAVIDAAVELSLTTATGNSSSVFAWILGKYGNMRNTLELEGSGAISLMKNSKNGAYGVSIDEKTVASVCRAAQLITLEKIGEK